MSTATVHFNGVNGATGQYANPPLELADLSSISVLDVIEAIEGPSDGGRCVLQDRPCGESGTCALHFPWTRARTQLLEELSAASLDSLDTLANPVPGRTAL